MWLELGLRNRQVGLLYHIWLFCPPISSEGSSSGLDCHSVGQSESRPVKAMVDRHDFKTVQSGPEMSSSRSYGMAINAPSSTLRVSAWSILIVGLGIFIARCTWLASILIPLHFCEHRYDSMTSFSSFLFQYKANSLRMHWASGGSLGYPVDGFVPWSDGEVTVRLAQPDGRQKRTEPRPSRGSVVRKEGVQQNGGWVAIGSIRPANCRFLLLWHRKPVQGSSDRKSCSLAGGRCHKWLR